MTDTTDRDAARKLISCDAVLDVPPEIAVCPICNAKLTASFDTWEQRDDGTWAGKPKTECETEPDIDDDNYDEWLSSHYAMPYVDWLPVEEAVAAWIDEIYDFDVDKTEV